MGNSKVATSKEKVTLSVPALSTVVLKANKVIDKTAVKVGKITSEMDFLTGYYETKASVVSQDMVKVTFFGRTSSDQPWTSLGTDTNAPYSVYIDPLNYLDKKLQIRADAINSKGAKYGLPITTITIPAS